METRITRHKAISTTLLVLFLFIVPSAGFAQTWDSATYETNAAECVTNLRYAQQAMEVFDSDRAWTYMELADEPCRVAREVLGYAIENNLLSSRERATRIGDYVAQEVAWVRLGVQMGMCADAQTWLTEMSVIIPGSEIPVDVQQSYIEATQAVLTCVSTDTTAGCGTPLNGTMTIGPGWGTQTGSGVRGGTADASLRFGTDAWGWISQQPNYQVEITAEGMYSFTSSSTGDLVMVILDPLGYYYFNDDYDGLSPGIVDYFSAGTHCVWIGEYTQTMTGTPFSVWFGETTYDDIPLESLLGRVSVWTGMSPATYYGGAGGLDSASIRFGGTCTGYITTTPTFLLDVSTYGLVSVQASSFEGDLTLVVSGPGGTFCNDDYDGLNSAISEYLSAGTYEVYVGEYTYTTEGTYFTATFSTSALPPPSTTVDPYVTPATATGGTAYVGYGYSPVYLNGTAGGTLDANVLYGGDCRGYIDFLPTFIMQVVDAGSYNVVVTATDSGDPTLIVDGPMGTYCNDDTNGLNPALSQYFNAGTYNVYIGAYHEGMTHPIMTSFSAAY